MSEQKDEFALWDIDTKSFKIVMSNGKPYVFREGFTGVWMSDSVHKDPLIMELLDAFTELMRENEGLKDYIEELERKGEDPTLFNEETSDE